MEPIHCYKSVMKAISDAAERAGKPGLSEFATAKLGNICKAIEKVSVESGLGNLNVTVDDKTGRIALSLECDDLIFYNGRTDSFFSLIKMLSSFSFTQSEGEAIKVTFRLDDDICV